MKSFSFKREGFLRGSLLVFLFLFSLGIDGCSEDENPPPNEPVTTIPVTPTDPVDPTPTTRPEPTPPPVVVIPEPEEEPTEQLSTLTFTVSAVRSWVIDNGPYNNPRILDVTETLGIGDHGDQVVFSACKKTGGCSDTDTFSFKYLGEDFEIDPDLGLVLSQRKDFRQKYLGLPRESHLVSISSSNLFLEGVLDCEDVSVPMIIAAPNDLSRNIPSNFSDEEKLECVYSSGKVLYVSGWLWNNILKPSLSDRGFADCAGFILWCVRDLALLDRDPDWNDDLPTKVQGFRADLIGGTSFAAPRVNMLADWMRRWFDVEETKTGTLQVFALIRTFAEDLGDPGIDCEWGMGRVNAEFFAPIPYIERRLVSEGKRLEEYQLINRRPVTIAYLSEKLEGKGFTGSFKEQLEKLEWRYRNEANATDPDKEEGYGEILEFPDCS